MKNISKAIIPLTKDELGKLKGGFGKVNITKKMGETDDTNVNCHGSILTPEKLKSDVNTNCKGACICSQ